MFARSLRSRATLGSLLLCTSARLPQASAQLLLPDAPQSTQHDGASLLRAESSFSGPWIWDGAATQAATAPPQTPAAATPPQTQGNQKDLKSEEKQRFLGVIPTRNVVINGQATPLRPSQKFDLFLHSTIDPFTFFVAGVVGGIEQAENAYPAFGQGAAGFGKRYGSAWADSTDGRLWGKAILPSIFHQDPRYFRLGTGSGGKRLLYGIAAVARCKGDDGHWQFAYSSISGNFIAGGISNLYFPSQDRGAALVLHRGLVVTAEGVVGYVFSEFYPDIVGHLKHRSQPAD